jgi:hypothetical protein
MDARKQFGDSDNFGNVLFADVQDNGAKAWPGVQFVDESSYSNAASARQQLAKDDSYDSEFVGASLDGDSDAANLPAIAFAANTSISFSSLEREPLLPAVTSHTNLKGDDIRGKKEATVEQKDVGTDLAPLLDEDDDVDHGADLDAIAHNSLSDAATFGHVDHEIDGAAGLTESISHPSVSEPALLEHADVNFLASNAATREDADHDANAAFNETQNQRSSIAPPSVIDGPLLESANGTTTEGDDAILHQIYEEVASVTPAQYSPWKPSDTISANAEEGSSSNIFLDLNLDDDDYDSAAAAFIQLRSLSGSRASYGVVSSANVRRLCTYLDNHVESLSGTASPIRQTEQNLLALAHLMGSQS